MERETEKLNCALKFRRYVRDRLTLMFDEQDVTPLQFTNEVAKAWTACERELRAIDFKHNLTEWL